MSSRGLIGVALGKQSKWVLPSSLLGLQCISAFKNEMLHFESAMTLNRITSTQTQATLLGAQANAQSWCDAGQSWDTHDAIPNMNMGNTEGGVLFHSPHPVPNFTDSFYCYRELDLPQRRTEGRHGFVHWCPIQEVQPFYLLLQLQYCATLFPKIVRWFVMLRYF